MRNIGTENFSENLYISYSHNQVNDPSSVKSILNNKSRLPNNTLNERSPVDFNVVIDTSQLTVDFHKCKSVLANQLCSFTIDTKESSGPNDIKVVITSPNGHHIQPKIINTQTNLCRIEYTPTEIGEYYIDIFFANQLIKGSPFKCNVFDPSKIKMKPTHSGLVDQVVKFEVDASQAGTGQLEIAVENGRIPCTFSNQGNLRFIPCFTPREPGKHEISVKFNNQDVPGSPFFCNIVDLSRLTINNFTQTYPIYKTNVIELNSSDLTSSEINVKMIAPSENQVPLGRSVTPYNTLKVTFQALEIGTHRLEIDYDGLPINGSPFELKVYDASKIIVSEVKGSEINKPCELTIDAANAGEGQLEIAINDGLIKNQVKQIKPGHYAVTFLPTKQDTYVIDVKFNDESVPGCPKRVFVRDFQNARLGSQIDESAIIGDQASFDLAGIHNLNDLKIMIKSPSGQEYIPKIHKSGQDECRVEWIPYELGSYSISVSYHDNIVKGTPVKVRTFDPKRVQVYNIQDGLVFKQNAFCVDASQAGEGSLEIGISCNGQYIPNQVKPIGNSKFEVHFLPQEAVIHYANISFNSIPVKNSPFAIKIIDTNLVIAQGKGLDTVAVNFPASFDILTGSAGGGQVRATGIGPKGENVPVKLYQQSTGDYIGEYTPISIGTHRVDIFYSNQPVAGSPFFVNVYDPQAVEIINLPSELTIGTDNLIEVDLSKTGSVDFDVRVTSPSGLNIPVNIEGQSIKKISFNPTEYGAYRISMLLGGHNLIGTPITLNSVDSKLPNAHGDGLHHGLEDKPAFFFVDSQGLKGNLEVNIEGPQQFTKNQIERQLDGSYMVKYTPVEVGLFKIYIKWNGRDLPGTPFVSYVVNPEKVKIIGGWQSILDYNNFLNLRLFEEKTINFDCSEAGPGSLTCSIIAPGNNKLPLRLTNQGTLYTLNFSALYEGEYKIHLLWDNQALPNTPITARTSQQFDLNRIEVNGYGIHEAKINQETDFIIDGSRAGGDLHGLPEIRFTGTRCDIDVRLQQIGHNIYRCSYVPQIPGAYLLSIKWNDRQIGDSPYKVNIGMNSDPSKVIVSGEGIKMGVFGQDIKALIDTRRAGPGELTAHCMGPQKVAFCEFFDHKDGTFTLFVKPQEIGKHILQVKYNDEHVPGSPFIIKIAGPPDATKVKVFGPGISHGALNKFKSKFICETKGAGAGQLTVRIRGPKGAFRVEMQRESQKDRTIFCKFDPTESGDYQINVKWSGQHVPGSPFNVHIFNNDDELDQFLRSNPEAAYNMQQQQMQNQLIS
ncbi:unnamed protein product [Brachionus calyciflorus]|uniref:Uncharacterized protein n=1 Tax=Brachionus calyciflorus TaxID=104777 RepID=A0A814A6P9_9BILA|nr:unnamed protein product [Brachionus calyciflorus]